MKKKKLHIDITDLVIELVLLTFLALAYLRIGVLRNQVSALSSPDTVAQSQQPEVTAVAPSQLGVTDVATSTAL
jgi:hypothetical protein